MLCGVAVAVDVCVAVEVPLLCLLTGVWNSSPWWIVAVTLVDMAPARTDVAVAVAVDVWVAFEVVCKTFIRLESHPVKLE